MLVNLYIFPTWIHYSLLFILPVKKDSSNIQSLLHVSLNSPATVFAVLTASGFQKTQLQYGFTLENAPGDWGIMNFQCCGTVLFQRLHYTDPHTWNFYFSS